LFRRIVISFNMCRVEERIYISAEGHRSKFEETCPCDKARNGKLCSKVKTRTTEYYPKRGIVPRNDTPSLINPPTRTGTGTYLGQPGIIIEFGKRTVSSYPTRQNVSPIESSSQYRTSSNAQTALSNGWNDLEGMQKMSGVSDGSNGAYMLDTTIPLGDSRSPDWSEPLEQADRLNPSMRQVSRQTRRHHVKAEGGNGSIVSWKNREQGV
jgi:hypothetical protein